MLRPIPDGPIVENELDCVSYRIQLGAGRFGIAYFAHELNESGDKCRNVQTCLTFTVHSDEWHGEVYFSGYLGT